MPLAKFILCFGQSFTHNSPLLLSQLFVTLWPCIDIENAHPSALENSVCAALRQWEISHTQAVIRAPSTPKRVGGFKYVHKRMII